MPDYLALGDSYTIGEAAPASENFPNQTVEILRSLGFQMAAPVIIATTGWTTDELAAAIRERQVHGPYSLVSLLIGVNNQYRGRSVENYQEEFQLLLRQAIHFAAGLASHVVVLSIPDWSATPFASTEAAAGRDKQLMAREIDAYNAIAKCSTLEAGCGWLDITGSTRENGSRAGFLAEDGLHPSGQEYAIWAQQLAPMFSKVLRA
ncbi:MAG: SGNH/GDSL hydrolase family protein [Bacteroidetes bacterium]|nr:SGNH/GDSL hydrolase family protein [Bacteroidota bacterium]MBS1630302.1 SGNH/GDSL hydrolase family protein [Bacteroidota bacterium]